MPRRATASDESGRSTGSGSPGRSGVVRQVRRHPVPAWWRDAKLGIFVHWTPASVPAFAPVGVDMGALLAQRRPDALAWSPVRRVVPELAAPSPTARWPSTTPRSTATGPTTSSPRDWEDGLAGWDPDDWARRFAATGARYVVLVTKHHDGYCLWPTEVRNPHVSGLFSDARRGGRAGRSGPRPGHALRRLLLGRIGLDLQRPSPGHVQRPGAGPARRRLPRVRRGPGPGADRSLPPSVLWNDISWPASTAKLAAAAGRLLPGRARRGGQRPLHAPLAGLGGGRHGDRPGGCWTWPRPDRPTADKGIVPPKPPLFDVRTPEYTTFDKIQTTPWECVRGIDASFGHNEQSDEARLPVAAATCCGRGSTSWPRAATCCSTSGPGAWTPPSPTAQVRRLDWLAEFTAASGDGPVRHPALDHARSGRGRSHRDAAAGSRCATSPASVTCSPSSAARARTGRSCCPRWRPDPTSRVLHRRRRGPHLLRPRHRDPRRAATAPLDPRPPDGRGSDRRDRPSVTR